MDLVFIWRLGEVENNVALHVFEAVKSDPDNDFPNLAKLLRDC